MQNHVKLHCDCLVSWPACTTMLVTPAILTLAHQHSPRKHLYVSFDSCSNLFWFKRSPSLFTIAPHHPPSTTDCLQALPVLPQYPESSRWVHEYKHYSSALLSNSQRSALLRAARRLIYHDPRCVKSLRQDVEKERETLCTVLLLEGLNDWNPGAYDWLGKRKGWLLFSLSGARLKAEQ